MDVEVTEHTPAENGRIPSLAAKLLEHVRRKGLPAGSHLTVQELAAHFGVSRFPIGQALALLAARGAVSHEPNRGYFTLADTPTPEALGLSSGTAATQAYFRMAEDHLNGLLPEPATEAFLRERYDLSRAQLAEALSRITKEGWAERRGGYGWTFSPVLMTPQSLEQTYRLRLALEPAALLEPGYRLDNETLLRCRDAEVRLLAGAIETDSADALHERGVAFHEAIVGASGNPYFLDAIRRINRLRRLLSYRSMIDRTRYRQQCEEHLAILDLLAQERFTDASRALRRHLQHTLRNHQKIRDVLA